MGTFNFSLLLSFKNFQIFNISFDFELRQFSFIICNIGYSSIKQEIKNSIKNLEKEKNKKIKKLQVYYNTNKTNIKKTILKKIINDINNIKKEYDNRINNLKLLLGK